MIADRFRTAVADGELDLPLPGGGRTTDRFDALWALGREDLSLARLAEAHTDAVAILHEARRTPPTGALLGVWAAEGPGSRLDATVTPDSIRLSGDKRWCSGCGIVTHALVTAHPGMLVLLPLDAPGIERHDDGWVAPAFSETNTDRITVDIELPTDAQVGEPGFYLDRPGFWHGAVGVAACWAGGAAGILDLLEKMAKDDAHGRAALARVRSEVWAMRSALHAAADAIDRSDGGANLALTVRHLVDRGVGEVIEHATRTLGPGPMAHDAAFAQRLAELQLYVRQSHAERDLESLGRLPSLLDGI